MTLTKNPSKKICSECENTYIIPPNIIRTDLAVCLDCCIYVMGKDYK